jgi:hypothetical protein
VLRLVQAVVILSSSLPHHRRSPSPCVFVRPALQCIPIATFVLRAKIRTVSCSSLWVIPDEKRRSISFAHQFLAQQLNATINSDPPLLAHFIVKISMYVKPYDVLIHISCIDEKRTLSDEPDTTTDEIPPRWRLRLRLCVASIALMLTDLGS